MFTVFVQEHYSLKISLKSNFRSQFELRWPCRKINLYSIDSKIVSLEQDFRPRQERTLSTSLACWARRPRLAPSPSWELAKWRPEHAEYYDYDMRLIRWPHQSNDYDTKHQNYVEQWIKFNPVLQRTDSRFLPSLSIMTMARSASKRKKKQGSKLI